jgi:DNA-binding LacI/PurR family transcriptional regulator
MKENQQHNTILDLAAALKLSPATVSRALNNTSYVKTETRQRVMEMAVKIGYRKNTMAAGLRNNRTNTIGLILPKISMYFHAAVVTVIQNLLHAQGYNLIIGQSNDDPEMEKELAETLFSSRVDALIVSCTLQTENFSHFDIFAAHKIPILFYDRVPPDGCKNIGLISGPLTSNLYQERAAGFIAALQFFDLPVHQELFFYQQLNPEQTLSAMQKMFTGKIRPDAVFVTSDRNAVAVVQYAKENGISIPDELRVIGYSNDPITAVISPSITTIDQFPSVFGDRLVQTLLEMLTDEDNTVYNPPVITPVELVERESG